ncbi:Uncharacterised protein [Vibrio cholerae]|nr:Uncharacterised protein [Vibrio cholerae]CSB89461.1 Uncharacterised protein [Vibrio cholerae]CSC66878.1 Uncharacterised protein [Vibrio cholerae]
MIFSTGFSTVTIFSTGFSTIFSVTLPLRAMATINSSTDEAASPAWSISKVVGIRFRSIFIVNSLLQTLCSRHNKFLYPDLKLRAGCLLSFITQFVYVFTEIDRLTTDLKRRVVWYTPSENNKYQVHFVSLCQC